MVAAQHVGALMDVWCTKREVEDHGEENARTQASVTK